MLHSPRILGFLLPALLAWSGAVAQRARISEETRVLPTYPFSEPNSVPILIQDARLYPYHSFDGYASDPEPRKWKIVHLENDYIEVFVLPEVGGKVWGAVVKKTGHEFIYRNEVMKFRNIALRGPWTSGGIEFNFGVIGHTPSTATPVDYTVRENADGSVSCFVGAMDLPSRTHWRVEIRLPADRAYFETNVLWYNPTPLEQPYYNWMTAAAFARNDLELSVPGDAYLEHSGEARSWPFDSTGRFLPKYASNTFDGHKSYHVVGELNDYFGGYYHDDDYGFGHWSRYEEMPGQKIWLWALSREGGVWEDLLTDSDGQYIEFQAGRLLVQYSPGADVNPITQVGFDPGASDRWSETWFPLEGTGGLTDASRDGAMYVHRDGDRLTVRINAFGNIEDTLRIWSDQRLVGSIPIVFSPLEPVERVIQLSPGEPYRVELPVLGLSYDPVTRPTLNRPFAADSGAFERISDVDRWVTKGRQLAKGRRYHEARVQFEKAIAEAPWHRDALLGLADVEFRRGRYEAGLSYANRALQLDAYDGQANFVAGNLYRALGRAIDAREAYGWATRSMAYRAVSYVELAEIMLADGVLVEAARYAQLALDYDRVNIPARQVLAIVGRRLRDTTLVRSMHDELLEIDPLHHFVAAERYLARPTDTSASALIGGMRSEYPDQTMLELAIDYVRRGAKSDAATLLSAGTQPTPLLQAWRAWLDDDPSRLGDSANLDFAFPYRRETIPVLEWAIQHSDQWSWRHLLALNLWARDRETEAAEHMKRIGDSADFAPFYIARAHLLESTAQIDPEPDLRLAVQLGRENRIAWIHLIRYLQEHSRWSDALATSASARTIFPDDFDLALLHVGSLNNLGRAREAIAILDDTRVLPSENAGDSHLLYEQAHLLAALDAMEDRAYRDAKRHAELALEWPEHLGEGRPYHPEERLPRFVLASAERALGNDEAARVAFRAIIEIADPPGVSSTRLDLLNLASLVAVGDTDAVDRAVVYGNNDAGQFLAALAEAVRRGEHVDSAVARLAPAYTHMFADLGGQLLRRAVSITR